MIEDTPSALPLDLLDELDLAAEATERLDDSGRQLHFEVDAHSGRLAVEVHDDEGNLVRRVGATEALDIALGAPADGH